MRISLIFCSIKVCFVFSSESPPWGDSNEYTQYTIFNIKKERKKNLDYPKSAAVKYFQRTQKRVRNSRGRRAINVRSTEDLLYVVMSAC